MNNQDHVTYPTAKLLKAAGYPQKACRVYDDEGDILDTFSPVTEDETAAPHLYDAMKWLREEKGLYVDIGLWKGTKPFFTSIYRFKYPTIDIGNVPKRFSTYEQACDAGIAAACEWLINQLEQ